MTLQAPIPTRSQEQAPEQPGNGALDAIPALVQGVRDVFESERTRPLAWRLQQLDGIKRLCKEREREILLALKEDMGKPELEAWTAEVQFVVKDVDFVRRRLARWMRPERVSTPLAIQPGRSAVHKEPLGVVLIISAWNYPFQLCLAPLVGALAAGNAAVVKPSEMAPATSALIARRLPEYVDPTAVRVVEGGVPETTALLAERWDHIFYTGNGTVGRVVMGAAAKHLTPVTLELGGKSPCFVDRDADLDVAVRRITWGKFYNAGQTCVAPDYLLVHEEVHDAVLERLQRNIRDFYGDDPRRSPDYARIINARHHRRLMALLPGSGGIVAGGQGDEADRYLAPTVLRDVPHESPVMAGEIFGPILPVLKVRNMDEGIRFVRARPKPLALYLFSNDGDVQRRVLSGTSSGDATVNHVFLHFSVPDLPFGGVGESGMGAYHGKASFDVFTHRRGVLIKSPRMDPPLLYPPYTEQKRKWLQRLI